MRSLPERCCISDLEQFEARSRPPTTELALSGLDAGELDHLRPLFGGAQDYLPELRRRASRHGTSQLLDPCFDFCIGETGIDLLVEPVDDVDRCVPGRSD